MLLEKLNLIEDVNEVILVDKPKMDNDELIVIVEKNLPPTIKRREKKPISKKETVYLERIISKSNKFNKKLDNKLNLSEALFVKYFFNLNKEEYKEIVNSKSSLTKKLIAEYNLEIGFDLYHSKKILNMKGSSIINYFATHLKNRKPNHKTKTLGIGDIEDHIVTCVYKSLISDASFIHTAKNISDLKALVLIDKIVPQLYNENIEEYAKNKNSEQILIKFLEYWEKEKPLREIKLDWDREEILDMFEKEPYEGITQKIEQYSGMLFKEIEVLKGFLKGFRSQNYKKLNALKNWDEAVYKDIEDYITHNTVDLTKKLDEIKNIDVNKDYSRVEKNIALLNKIIKNYEYILDDVNVAHIEKKNEYQAYKEELVEKIKVNKELDKKIQDINNIEYDKKITKEHGKYVNRLLIKLSKDNYSEYKNDFHLSNKVRVLNEKSREVLKGIVDFKHINTEELRNKFNPRIEYSKDVNKDLEQINNKLKEYNIIENNFKFLKVENNRFLEKKYLELNKEVLEQHIKYIESLKNSERDYNEILSRKDKLNLYKKEDAEYIRMSIELVKGYFNFAKLVDMDKRIKRYINSIEIKEKYESLILDMENIVNENIINAWNTVKNLNVDFKKGELKEDYKKIFDVNRKLKKVKDMYENLKASNSTLFEKYNKSESRKSYLTKINMANDNINAFIKRLTSDVKDFSIDSLKKWKIKIDYNNNLFQRYEKHSTDFYLKNLVHEMKNKVNQTNNIIHQKVVEEIKSIENKINNFRIKYNDIETDFKNAGEIKKEYENLKQMCEIWERKIEVNEKIVDEPLEYIKFQHNLMINSRMNYICLDKNRRKIDELGIYTSENKDAIYSCKKLKQEAEKIWEKVKTYKSKYKIVNEEIRNFGNELHNFKKSINRYYESQIKVLEPQVLECENYMNEYNKKSKIGKFFYQIGNYKSIKNNKNKLKNCLERYKELEWIKTG